MHRGAVDEAREITGLKQLSRDHCLAWSQHECSHVNCTCIYVPESLAWATTPPSPSPSSSLCSSVGVENIPGVRQLVEQVAVDELAVGVVEGGGGREAEGGGGRELEEEGGRELEEDMEGLWREGVAAATCRAVSERRGRGRKEGDSS